MTENFRKALKRSTLLFFSNPVPFNGKNYQKHKKSGINDQPLFRLRNKFKKNYLLVMYYLTKFDVIWNGFWVIPKITSANLCKTIDDIINYSTFFHPFESRKCGKDGKNYKNLKSRERKELFRWNKNILHTIWRAIIWWKNKKLIKNSWHKFKDCYREIKKLMIYI